MYILCYINKNLVMLCCKQGQNLSFYKKKKNLYIKNKHFRKENNTHPKQKKLISKHVK